LALSARCIFVYKNDLAFASELGVGFAVHASELAFSNHQSCIMARKKAKDQEALYSHVIRTRITETTYKKLERFVTSGDSASVGEVARRILSGEQLKVFHVDSSMQSAMEELLFIRKELRSIGININQVVRHFNSQSNPQLKALDALKAGSQYQQVGAKVDQLMAVISQLAERWLQR